VTLNKLRQFIELSKINWWSNLTKEQQELYLKLHKKSKKHRLSKKISRNLVGEPSKSDDFDQAINDRPRKGESEILHHVSKNNSFRSKFNPLSHFGTADAARDRAISIKNRLRSARWINSGWGNKAVPSKFTHYEVRLRLGKVKRIEDTGLEIPWEYLIAFAKAGIIAPREKKFHMDIIDKNKAGMPWPDYLVSLVKKKGIDTLIYKNTTEDPGKLSFIITDPSQVRVLHRQSHVKINYGRLVPIWENDLSLKQFLKLK
jgi:hypothetical protein